MNTDFTVYDAQGVILRSGSCPADDFSLQVAAGEFITAQLSDPAKDAVDPATQQVIPGGRVIPPAPPLTYIQARVEMYPRVEEQLDMLWHAMDDDPAKRLEPFYSTVKAVKDANPKTDDYVFDVGSL